MKDEQDEVVVFQTEFTGRTTRYYINLLHPKKERNIATREIQRQEDHNAFDEKIERQEKIVECTVNGIVLNELDQETEQEYNQLISANSEIEQLKQQLAESKAQNAQIKPSEVPVSNVIVNDEPVVANVPSAVTEPLKALIVNNVSVDSDTLQDELPTIALSSPKKAKRVVKRKKVK